MKSPSEERAFTMNMSKKYSKALDVCIRAAEEKDHRTSFSGVVVSKSLVVNIPKESSELEYDFGGIVPNDWR